MPVECLERTTPHHDSHLNPSVLLVTAICKHTLTLMLTSYWSLGLIILTRTFQRVPTDLRPQPPGLENTASTTAAFCLLFHVAHHPGGGAMLHPAACCSAAPPISGQEPKSGGPMRAAGSCVVECVKWRTTISLEWTGWTSGDGEESEPPTPSPPPLLSRVPRAQSAAADQSLRGLCS